MTPEVTFTITVEEDDTPLDGAFDSGDAEADRELQESLLQRLRGGDTWAWAYVKVTGTYQDPRLGTFTASDSLGGCSYANEKDFRETSGYFADMCETIRRDIENQMSWAIRIGGTGEVFTLDDTRQLAQLIHKRFGRDRGATKRALGRLLESLSLYDYLSDEHLTELIGPP